MGDVGIFSKPQDTDGKISKCCHDPGAGFRSDAAAIFVVGYVADVMQLVFNSPVSPIDFKESFWTGFLGRKAGNAAHYFVAQRFSRKIRCRALYPHNLFLIRELKVSFEFGAGPDSSGLDPTMSFVHRFMLRGEKLPAGEA